MSFLTSCARLSPILIMLFAGLAFVHAQDTLAGASSLSINRDSITYELMYEQLLKTDSLKGRDIYLKSAADLALDGLYIEASELLSDLLKPEVVDTADSTFEPAPKTPSFARHIALTARYFSYADTSHDPSTTLINSLDSARSNPVYDAGISAWGTFTPIHSFINSISPSFSLSNNRFQGDATIIGSGCTSIIRGSETIRSSIELNQPYGDSLNYIANDLSLTFALPSNKKHWGALATVTSNCQLSQIDHSSQASYSELAGNAQATYESTDGSITGSFGEMLTWMNYITYDDSLDYIKTGPQLDFVISNSSIFGSLSGSAEYLTYRNNPIQPHELRIDIQGSFLWYVTEHTSIGTDLTYGYTRWNRTGPVYYALSAYPYIASDTIAFPIDGYTIALTPTCSHTMNEHFSYDVSCELKRDFYPIVDSIGNKKLSEFPQYIQESLIAFDPGFTLNMSCDAWTASAAITIPIQYVPKNSLYTLSSTRGIRLEGDATIHIKEWLSFLLHAGYERIISTSDNSQSNNLSASLSLNADF